LFIIDVVILDYFKVKKMKKTKKIIKNLLTSLSLIGLGVTFAAIPNQYIANHDIVDDREQISQIFVQIEANNKI